MIDEIAIDLDVEIMDYEWYEESLEEKLKSLVEIGKVASDMPVKNTIPVDIEFNRLKYVLCK